MKIPTNEEHSALIWMLMHLKLLLMQKKDLTHLIPSELGEVVTDMYGVSPNVDDVKLLLAQSYDIQRYLHQQYHNEMINICIYVMGHEMYNVPMLKVAPKHIKSQLAAISHTIGLDICGAGSQEWTDRYKRIKENSNYLTDLTTLLNNTYINLDLLQAENKPYIQNAQPVDGELLLMLDELPSLLLNNYLHSTTYGYTERETTQIPAMLLILYLNLKTPISPSCPLANMSVFNMYDHLVKKHDMYRQVVMYCDDRYKASNRGFVIGDEPIQRMIYVIEQLLLLGCHDSSQVERSDTSPKYPPKDKVLGYPIDNTTKKNNPIIKLDGDVPVVAW